MWLLIMFFLLPTPGQTYSEVLMTQPTRALCEEAKKKVLLLDAILEKESPTYFKGEYRLVCTRGAR